MKIESLLSRLAALGVMLALSGLAFTALALPLFCAATAVFILLTAIGDYTRLPRYAVASSVAVRPGEPLPLAA